MRYPRNFRRSLRWPQSNGDNPAPCPYSHFVFYTGIAIAAGLLISGAWMLQSAPYTTNTYLHLYYCNTGKSCIESALAVILSTIIAAGIGEIVFHRKS